MLKSTCDGICNVTQFTNLRSINGKINSVCNFKRTFFGKCCNLYSHQLIAHYDCVNAMEFSNGAQSYLASGGDDRRVLLWDISAALYKPHYKPVQMNEPHMSNIFCLAFGADNSRIFSSGNDKHLFVHDISTCYPLKVYPRNTVIYSVSTHPTDPNIFATASEDGQLCVTDMRSNSQSPVVSVKFSPRKPFHGVAFNPVEPSLLGWANGKMGAGVWDVKVPQKILMRYDLWDNDMSVRFNETGSRLLVLRRGYFPGVYETTRTNPISIAQFRSDTYANSCTMKSGCFASENDEYVVSGSEDFKIYLWKIPNSNRTVYESPVTYPHMVLHGHRSIVNQVRYNKEMQLLVSCGIEKVIHLWSPFKYKNFTGTTRKPSTTASRALYTRQDRMRMLQSAMSPTDDYGTVDEDPRMLAFFDSLVENNRNSSSISLLSDEENPPSRETLWDSIANDSDATNSRDDTDANVPRVWRQLSTYNRPNSSFGAASTRMLIWPGQTHTNASTDIDASTDTHASTDTDASTDIDSSRSDSDSSPGASNKPSNVKKAVTHFKKINATHSSEDTSNDDADHRSRTRRFNAQRRRRKVPTKWGVKRFVPTHHVSPSESDPHCSSNLIPHETRQSNPSTSREEETQVPHEPSHAKQGSPSGARKGKFAMAAMKLPNDLDERSSSDDE